MKTFFLALATMMAFSGPALANENFSSESSATYRGRGDDNFGIDIRIGRGDRRRCEDRWGRPVPCPTRPPGGGPGYPGPGYPGPGYPGPGPGYPPPYQRYEEIYCESRDQRYAECYFNSRGVTAVTLVRQRSNSPCIAGQSFGIQRDRIWVNNGCRANFGIHRR